MGEKFSIKKARLLAVEGKDEENFFEAGSVTCISRGFKRWLSKANPSLGSSSNSCSVTRDSRA